MGAAIFARTAGSFRPCAIPAVDPCLENPFGQGALLDDERLQRKNFAPQLPGADTNDASPESAAYKNANNFSSLFYDAFKTRRSAHLHGKNSELDEIMTS